MRSGVIEWAVRAVSLAGQSVCGDRHVVVATARSTLVAVVDGVGHGGAAAAAANKAVAIVEEQGAGVPLTTLVQRCHAGLREGRGAVMSLAMLDGDARSLTWLGIGNVRGELCRRAGSFGWRPETLLLRGGVVGKQLPSLRTASVVLARGDVLVLATDGIAGDFMDGMRPYWDPQRIADDVVARYSTQADDALVLVARFVGCGP